MNSDQPVGPSEPITADDLSIVPANHASAGRPQAVFGTRDYSGRCNCQRFKTRGWFWEQATDEQRGQQPARPGQLRRPGRDLAPPVWSRT